MMLISSISLKLGEATLHSLRFIRIHPDRRKAGPVKYCCYQLDLKLKVYFFFDKHRICLERKKIIKDQLVKI